MATTAALTPRRVLLLATIGRTAAAHASDEYAAPDLRVEGHVAYRAATEPAADRPGWLETAVYIRATNTEGGSCQRMPPFRLTRRTS